VNIKLPVDLRPAYILGKRNSTQADCGMLRTVANTKAEALAQLERDVLAKLRTEPAYRGGTITGRVYALTCEGAGQHGAYAWCVTILDPSKGKYCQSGALCFEASEHNALCRLDEYVASCEAAHEVSKCNCEIESSYGEVSK
jgi:hypothetical protein